jgi:integrase
MWSFVLESHDDRRLKTASSRRVVPVHSALIEAGLLDYVERQRQQGHERLFPTLRANGLNSLGNVFGKFYGRWSRKLVPDRRKTAHSWRHTVATKTATGECARGLDGRTPRLDTDEDGQPVRVRAHGCREERGHRAREVLRLVLKPRRLCEESQKGPLTTCLTQLASSLGGVPHSPPLLVC